MWYDSNIRQQVAERNGHRKTTEFIAADIDEFRRIVDLGITAIK